MMTVEKLERSRQENMAYYGFGPSAMKELRVCTVCGTPAPLEKNFCVECGHRLPDKTLYDLYLERHEQCSACGTVLTEERKVCPGTERSCGNNNMKNCINRKELSPWHYLIN